MLTWLLNSFLDWILEKVATFLIGVGVIKRTRDQIDQQGKDSVKPLEDAKTADEIDKGADDALDNL